MNKRKALLVIIAVLLCGVLFGTIHKIRDCYELDRVNHSLIVKKDERSNFSYAVYEEHVELLEYQGEEKNIDIPKTLMGKPVTVIGEECFQGKKEITSVNLSCNIIEIKDRAFGGCSELEYVTGDANIESVPDYAFISCSNLKSVSFGHSIKQIGEGAFQRCESLESIGEQPCLETIGFSAFAYAGTLSDFNVPENTDVGNWAFDPSEWLRNKTDEFVIVGKGSLLAYNGSEEIVEIPLGVTKIDCTAFTHSAAPENIQTIYIPNTVVEITSMAFYGLGNITVYIPASVTAIDVDMEGYKPGINTLTSDNATIKIVTTKDSHAEEYAKKFGIECEIVESW